MCFSFERSISEKHGDIPERTLILWALTTATIIRSSNVEATITIPMQVLSTSTVTMATTTVSPAVDSTTYSFDDNAGTYEAHITLTDTTT